MAFGIALTSLFRRKNIWRWTWIFIADRIKKNLDQILTNSWTVRAYSDSLQAWLPQSMASAKGVEEMWGQVATTIHASAADTADESTSLPMDIC